LGWNSQAISLRSSTRKNELYTCEALLIELLAVLQRKKFSAQLALIHTDALRLSNHYRRIAKSASLPSQIPRICRDPMDDVVLACAHAVQADAIVSGDKDLLSLGGYGSIPILRASDAILIL
jgi:putative PIN family toxin of toxin-antitoxin system